MLAVSLLSPTDDSSDKAILAKMKLLKFPVLATLKLDGIRAIRANGTLLSRTLKQIPNKSIRERSMVLSGGFDMELWNPNLSYDQIESIVMSKEHKDSDLIEFHILDTFNIENANYEQRMWHIKKDTKCYSNCPFWFEEPSLCNSAEELFEHFIRFESNDGEGICFRVPWGKYKQGRSTLKEQYLVKLCRYIREEVTILSTYEQLENANNTNHNAIGNMNRATFVDNKFGKNTLGGFNVIRANGDTFSVGTGVGLTDIRRKELWEKRGELVGKVITIKYKGGGKIKPRSPVMVGFRKDNV